MSCLLAVFAVGVFGGLVLVGKQHFSASEKYDSGDVFLDYHTDCDSSISNVPVSQTIVVNGDLHNFSIWGEDAF